MNVEIRTRGIAVVPELRERVERRASFALDRFADRIARVVVRVGDVNGPRGGVDQRCQVEVKLRSGASVRVAHTAHDAGTAIDQAIHRAANAIGRTLRRERQAMLELVGLAAIAR
jgi:ribosome-associated translation inhibitor RaiA